MTHRPSKFLHASGMRRCFMYISGGRIRDAVQQLAEGDLDLRRPVAADPHALCRTACARDGSYQKRTRDWV
jgi:hypothetical protein